MRKSLLICAVILFCSHALFAQQKQALTASATTCTSTGASCLIYGIDQTVGGATFTVGSNSGNTLQFEASGDGGTTWVALNVTPSNSTTAVTSTTGTGTWQSNIAAYTTVRIRCSTFSSGSAVVSILTSIASARSGGGGGAGGGVTSFSGDGTVITNSASTGAVTATIAGTSGGIPYFSSSSGWNTSAALASTALVVGGGAGNPPATGNGDFTYATHTLTGGAAGLVDLSAEAAGGFKVPVVAGCTAAANGNICYDSTNANLHVRAAGGVDAIVYVVATASLPTINAIPKSQNANTSTFGASSILDDAKDITSTEIASLGNRVALTSDFTDSTSTTLQLISNGAGNELKWTLPTSKALNVSFHCSLLYDQATALVSDSFGIGITGTAPTQANSSGVAYVSTSSFTEGNLTGLASTTPTAVVTFTPTGSVATVYRADLDGTVEQPSNATPGVLGIYVATTTGTDNILVKRGSYCSLF